MSGPERKATKKALTIVISVAVVLALCCLVCGVMAVAGGCLWLSLSPTAPAGPTRTGFTPPTDPIGVVVVRPGEPIHLACWLDLTGSAAELGLDSQRGIEIAIDDRGRQLLGFPIRLTSVDSGCSTEGGRAAATQLAADSTIVAAIGSTCSIEARVGAPILWKAGIVTVSPSNTAPDLTTPQREPGYEGYLRVSHNDMVQGVVAARFAWEQLKVRTAATIHEDGLYSRQLQVAFAETFQKYGGTITAQEAVSPSSTDLRPVLSRIAADKPDLLYYPVFMNLGAVITRQARQIPGLEKITLLSADGLFLPDFYRSAGESAIGMYHTNLDTTSFGADYKAFLDRYQARYGEKPKDLFHAYAYDATMMILSAIEQVAVKGPDGTLYIGRQALRDALFATRNFKGLTGKLTCNEYGDCADPKIAVYQTTKDHIESLTLPTTPVWTPY